MCYKPVYIERLDMFVPCGKCLECSQSVSSEWALRICLEASLYEKNCCVTLTYDGEHLPHGGILCPRDYQLFLKRLRKAIYPATVRYFLSGEYGDKRGRPHYHVILFGYCPDDLVWKFNRGGRDFYTSETVANIWQNGQILVGMVDWHTAFYTAKYLQKLVFSDKSVIPFVRMSTHPGIGYDAISGKMLRTDKVYFNGKTYRIPRYFYKVFEREGIVLDEIRNKHFNKARKITRQIKSDDLTMRENKARDFLGLSRVNRPLDGEFAYDKLCREYDYKELYKWLSLREPLDFNYEYDFQSDNSIWTEINNGHYIYLPPPKIEQITYL